MSNSLNGAAGALLARYRESKRNGFCDTDLQSVRFFFTDRPVLREPLHYPPGLAIILSGKKIGFLDGRRFEYGAGSYLAVGLPLIFECETQASTEVPLCGLFISLCPTMLSELSAFVPVQSESSADLSTHQGVEPLQVQHPMAETIARLVEQLCTPPQAQAFGAGTIREVLFHALSDGHGRVLKALTRMGKPEARIADLLRWAENQEGAHLTTDTLASRAAMSPATLHRYFKSVTGYPPMVYFKRQKLFRAKVLLNARGLTVAQAARSIGYSDPANFSRDYLKLFGHPPSQDRQSAR